MTQQATLPDVPRLADPLAGEHPTEAPRRLFRAWLASVTTGEFLGFCVPAVIGALLMSRSALVTVPALMVAGFVEGSILGWSQVRVLRRAVPQLPARRWVVHTGLGAAAAWLLGLLPSSLYLWWSHWPLPVLLFGAAVLASGLLCTIGVAQWLLLRDHLPRAGRWIAVTAAAWCLGLVAFTGVTSPLWHPGQPAVLVAAIGVLGGLTLAVTMAAATGWGLTRLLPR